MQELKRCPYCDEKKLVIMRSVIDILDNPNVYPRDSPLIGKYRFYKCEGCGRHFEVKIPCGLLRLIKKKDRKK